MPDALCVTRRPARTKPRSRSGVNVACATGGSFVVDPLMAKGFPGWCSRVARVCRSDFGPLAKLAAVPAGLTFAQLVVGGDLPIVVVVFGLLMLLAMSLVASAGLFTVVRRANGEFAPWGAAVRFALSRM